MEVPNDPFSASLRISQRNRRAYRNQIPAVRRDEAGQLIVPLCPMRDDIVAQTIGKREFRRDTPGVLSVKTRHPARETEESSHIDLRTEGSAQQKIRQAVTGSRGR